MSEEEDKSSICASCGIAEVDEIKLKNCTACYLIKYCSVKCQRDHRSKHKRDCKKRAAELRDELLFKQPESTHLGDCPICMLPLPLDPSKTRLMSCCSNVICNGCHHYNLLQAKNRSCPFCRNPSPETEEECEKLNMKRIKLNDPAAIRSEGIVRFSKGDYGEAFEYLTKAAGLGDVGAHYRLSYLYHIGRGVEKDKGKELHHLEEAAIGGHPESRHPLACQELKNGNTDKAVKHFSIAAKLGCDNSMKSTMNMFKGGCVSKEDLAAILRAHHAAVDAMKSPQREEAEEYWRSKEKHGSYIM